MNKKFSTLLTVGLLIGGSLFNMDAKVVAPADFLSAIEGDSLKVDALNLGDDLKIELSGDVNIVATPTGQSSAPTTNGHLIIKRPGLTITKESGKDVTFTGRFAIEADGVTVDGLKITHHVTVNNGTYWKTAITVVAKSATVTNNTITCTSESDKLANGITIFPTAKDAAFTVKDNTIKNANSSEGQWTSSAIIVAEGISAPNGGTSAVLDDFDVTSISNNTYDKCAADYVYKDYTAGVAHSYKAAQITPVVGANGSITNTNYVKAIVENSDKGAGMVFNGTAEQLNKALNSLSTPVDVNVAIATKDGAVVTGIKYMPKDEIEVTSANTIFNLAAKPVDGAYYLLVKAGEASSAQADSVLVMDNGAPKFVALAAVTADQLADPANYWKVATKTAIETVDYSFTNKAEEPYTLKIGDETIVRALGNVAYNNGVAFALAQDNSSAPIVGSAHYFGLYTADVYQLSAKDLNWFEKDGFSVTIAPAGVKGNPFAGHLTPMVWNSTTKEFDVATTTDKNLYFMTEAEQYIVVKEYEANGSIYNQSIYAFDVANEEDLVADLKKAKVEDRKLFGEFNAFYFPKTAIVEDELHTATIDSMTVKVLGKNAAGQKELQAANVGFAYLTEKKVATLAASIKFGLNEIAISMGDNVVKPENLLKDAYFTITQLVEDDADLRLAVNACTNKGWVESVGNELEAQWAITYDEKKAEYTLTNRENTAVKFTAGRNQLREDEDTKDNYYVFSDDVDNYVVEVKAVEGTKDSDGYKYLGDIENQRFRMAHHSGVYKQNAWFVENKDGFVVLDVDATPMEIKALGVDTAKVKTTVGFYKDGKYTTKDYTLKAPVYMFANMNEDELGLIDGKYAFQDNQDTLAIRQDGEYYNLRVVKNNKVMECAKVFASTSDKDAGFLKKQQNLYAETTNDLFVVESLDRPIYRRLGTTIENDGFTGAVDTAKFYRTNDVTNYYLYENSVNRNTQGGKPSLNFLGETHLNDLPASAALPILIDTAYVRNDTKKPLYMLAVRDEAWVEGTPFKPCDKEDNHGYDQDGNALTAEQCPHATPAVPGYRKAHYLVSLADSIETDHDMILYKGATRLAFVPATHFENDTLVIASSEFTGKKKLAKRDSLSFVNKKGEQVMNPATFAFRLVDPADTENGDFYIETEVDGETNYVHVLNTVPVLVTRIEDAAPFNIESAEGEAATANDEISAAGVKVIAGEGQVIIKGAQGKKVAISNILGQTIANTVLSSDEASIAAPAGVVVVAVEGGAAVKAIVK